MTISDVEKLLSAGKIRGFTVHQKDKPKDDKPKKAKYGNTKIEENGIVFDSKKEYRRYKDLQLLLKAGKIGLLERQITYRLEVNGKLICKYIADHRYFDYETNDIVVEDVKSDITRKHPVYRLKKKLMKKIFGIEIFEY